MKTMLVALTLLVTTVGHGARRELDITRKFKVGQEVYELSVPGLRSFMNELETEDPKVHEALLSDLHDLEARQTRATLIPIAVGVTGASLVVIAAATAPVDYALLATGFAVAGLGAVLPLWLSNQPEDFEGFVEKHNKIESGPKMKIFGGVAPSPSGVSGTFAIRF